jgi:hypothetical protein
MFNISLQPLGFLGTRCARETQVVGPDVSSIIYFPESSTVHPSKVLECEMATLLIYYTSGFTKGLIRICS